jgi:hypothetical protein
MVDRPFLVGPVLDRRTDSSPAVPVHLLHRLPEKEHFALLKSTGSFDRFLRKGDLLHEGVAAVFGLAGSEAELLGLCFDSRSFTPTEAVTWLAEWGFAVVQFISTVGG